MHTLRGKKALVTGAATGIGRAIAIGLAREGVHLYLVDVDDVSLESAARKARSHGVEVVTRHCDLADSAHLAATVEAVLAHWGHLNILINNAGIADRCHTHEMHDSEWDRIVTVNLLAPIALTRMLLPTLLANDAHLLNVCSIFGLTTTRKLAAYQTSKFGLVGFTAALRAEYGSPEFGVTAVCPGFVQTPLLKRIVDTRSRRVLVPPAWMVTTPEKVAARALDAIRKNKGIVVVTAFARINWLVARLSPGLIDFLNRRPWRYWRNQRLRRPSDATAESMSVTPRGASPPRA